MSSTPVVTATEIYLVRDGQPLTLEIEIGDEQAGGTSIIWNGAIRAVPNSQVFTLADDGGAVRTAALHCVTRVRDINEHTNRTSVTYILRGGRSEMAYPFAVEAPEEGFAEYVIDFVFI